jgi:hypothetical protein
VNLNEFIKNNDSRLFSACKKINYNLHKELYSELYLHLHENWNKFKKLENDDVIYLSIDFIKKQLIWKNTPLKKTIEVTKYKNFCIEYNDTFPEQPFNDIAIEIFAESGSEKTNEYLLDLHNDFNEQQIKAIINVLLKYDKLTLKDKIFFDLYIQQNLPLRDVAKKINISLTSTHKLIKEMIVNVKKLIENGNNN